MEPVFYHDVPESLNEEWVHAFKPVSVVDGTARQGGLAMVAIRERIPYVGIVHTKAHADMLYGW